MSTYQEHLREAIQLFETLGELETPLRTAAGWCVEALAAGRKLLLCGNGGSSAQAQHLAAELMGRYKDYRRPLAVVALTADTAVLTCVGNDYSFEEVFARQVRALGRPGDVLVVFSTSGNSPNILAALVVAKEAGLKSVAILGCAGGRAGEMADCPLIVRHADTARAQEGHQFLIHALMDEIEAGLNH
ncbi:MAG: SIS domain-containing protein [Bryobacteraceae bacterium]